jgi:hypothetical protein
MNERIKALVEQARKYADKNRPGSFVKYDPEWFAFYNKKFAELIIQEAGEAFWSEACHVSDLAYEEYYRNSKKVKRHFGIEL